MSMRRRVRLAGLVLVVVGLGPALPHNAGALVSGAKSCVVARPVDSYCSTPVSMDPTYHYQVHEVYAPGYTTWSVTVHGAPGETAFASSQQGSPVIGKLAVTHCPCFAEISLGYESWTLAIVTGHA